jgi:hypothetical protein
MKGEMDIKQLMTIILIMMFAYIMYTVIRKNLGGILG